MERDELEARVRAVAGYIRNVADTIAEGGGNDGWADAEGAAILAGQMRGANAFADAEWTQYSR